MKNLKCDYHKKLLKQGYNWVCEKCKNIIKINEIEDQLFQRNNLYKSKNYVNIKTYE